MDAPGEDGGGLGIHGLAQVAHRGFRFGAEADDPRAGAQEGRGELAEIHGMMPDPQRIDQRDGLSVFRHHESDRRAVV